MNHFDMYLVKTASIDALVNSANNIKNSPSSGATVTQVQRASEKSGNKISKSQAAMLIALGVGVGATGALVYKQQKEKKRALRP